MKYGRKCLEWAWLYAVLFSTQLYANLLWIHIKISFTLYAFSSFHYNFMYIFSFVRSLSLAPASACLFCFRFRLLSRFLSTSLRVILFQKLSTFHIFCTRIIYAMMSRFTSSTKWVGQRKKRDKKTKMIERQNERKQQRAKEKKKKQATQNIYSYNKNLLWI